MRHCSHGTTERSSYLSVILCLLTLALSACSTAESPSNVLCAITSHQPSGNVTQNETLAGSVQGMQSKWYLFAYTRANMPGQPYWRSDKSAVLVGSNWTVDAVYGDETTKPGQAFETVIVVTTNQDAAKQVAQITDIKNSTACEQITLHR